MTYFIKYILLVMSVYVLSGCATSMAPTEFIDSLRKTTTSKYFDHPSAKNELASGRCKLIAGGRRYTAPIGFTVSGDVENAAEGIDQWVEADNGNSYIINSFDWISVNDQGVTQLIVNFDTMNCL